MTNLIRPAQLEPYDVWHSIFEYLNHTDLAKAARVCKLWQAVCDLERFQMQKYLSHCGNPNPEMLRRYSWAQINQARARLARNLQRNSFENLDIYFPRVLEPLMELHLSGEYYCGSYQNGQRCLWNSEGKQIYVFGASEKLLHFINNKFLTFEAAKPQIVQIRDLPSLNTKFVFCPPGWTFFKEMKGYFISETKVLVLLRRTVDSRFDFRFFAVDLLTGGCQPCTHALFQSNTDAADIEKLMKSLVVGIDGNLVHVAQIADANIEQAQAVNGRLFVIAEKMGMPSLYRIDMHTGKTSITHYPANIDLSFSKNILVENFGEYLRFFNLSKGVEAGIYHLKDLVKDHPSIRKLESCYIQGYAFVLVKETSGQTFLYKIHVQSGKKVLLNAITNRNASSHLWLLNDKVIFHYKIMQRFLWRIFLCHQGLEVYDYAKKIFEPQK